MARDLWIAPAAWAHIVAHARREAPLECCGLLVGTGRRVTTTVASRNLDASTVRYTIDPVTYLRAARDARLAGCDVVGAYHSHPASPPIPSATDLAEGVDAPFLYIIAGPVVPGGEPVLRAWEKRAGAFVELALHAEDSPKR